MGCRADVMSRKQVAAQMGRRAVEMSRNWEVTQLKRRARKKSCKCQEKSRANVISPPKDILPMARPMVLWRNEVLA